MPLFSFGKKSKNIIPEISKTEINIIEKDKLSEEQKYIEYLNTLKIAETNIEKKYKTKILKLNKEKKNQILNVIKKDISNKKQKMSDEKNKKNKNLKSLEKKMIKTTQTKKNIKKLQNDINKLKNYIKRTEEYLSITNLEQIYSNKIDKNRINQKKNVNSNKNHKNRINQKKIVNSNTNRILNIILKKLSEDNFSLVIDFVNELIDPNLQIKTKEEFKEYLETLKIEEGNDSETKIIKQKNKDIIIKILKTIYKLTSENYKKEDFEKNLYISMNLQQNKKLWMDKYGNDIFMFLIRYVIPEHVFKNSNILKNKSELLKNNFKVNYEKNKEEHKFVYLLMIIYKFYKDESEIQGNFFQFNQASFNTSIKEEKDNLSKQENIDYKEIYNYLIECAFGSYNHNKLSKKFEDYYEKVEKKIIGKISKEEKLFYIFIYVYELLQKERLLGKIIHESTKMNLPISFQNFTEIKYFMCNSDNIKEGSPDQKYLEENCTFYIENGLVIINKDAQKIYNNSKIELDNLMTSYPKECNRIFKLFRIKYEIYNEKIPNEYYSKKEGEKPVMYLDNVMNNIEKYLKDYNFGKKFDEEVLGYIDQNQQRVNLDKELRINKEGFDKICGELDNTIDSIYIVEEGKPVKSYKKEKKNGKKNINKFYESLFNFKPEDETEEELEKLKKLEKISLQKQINKQQNNATKEIINSSLRQVNYVSNLNPENKHSIQSQMTKFFKNREYVNSNNNNNNNNKNSYHGRTSFSEGGFNPNNNIVIQNGGVVTNLLTGVGIGLGVGFGVGIVGVVGVVGGLVYYKNYYTKNGNLTEIPTTVLNTFKTADTNFYENMSKNLTDEAKEKYYKINQNVDELMAMNNNIHTFRNNIKLWFTNWGNENKYVIKKEKDLKDFQGEISIEIDRLRRVQNIMLQQDGINLKNFSKKFSNLISSKSKNGILTESQTLINKKLKHIQKFNVKKEEINKFVLTDEKMSIDPKLKEKCDKFIENLNKSLCEELTKTNNDDTAKKLGYFLQENWCKIKLVSRQIFKMDKYLFLVFLLGIQFLPILGQVALGYVVIVNGKRWTMDFNK